MRLLFKNNLLWVIAYIGCTMSSACHALTCQDEGADVYFHFPPVMVVSPSAEAGTMLSDFVAGQGNLRWQCQYTSSTGGLSLAFQSLSSASRYQRIRVGGTSYLAFPTNITGIALILRVHKKVQINQHNKQEQLVPVQYPYQLLSRLHGAPISDFPHYIVPVNTELHIDQLEAALVKTDSSSVRSGLISGSMVGEIGLIPHDSDNTYAAVLVHAHRLFFNQVHIVAPTCTTSDVLVTLPGQRTMDFSGYGARFGHWIPFKIPVEQCPATMQHFRYRLLRPSAGFIDESLRIIRSSQRDDAQGMGLQLADEHHQLIEYAKETMVNTRGQQHVDIPLWVRYAKPSGKKVMPGSVNAAVLFELSYD